VLPPGTKRSLDLSIYPPQKYWEEDDPVLMLELVPDHLLTGQYF
jgi:hypothetical protein